MNTRDPLARIRRMIGEAGVQRLAEARVCVVGLGAVGSFATEALARAGVGHLRLVDFDTVHPSNLNRQLIALHSTLDRPKAPLAAERVQDINPRCVVEPLSLFAHVETLETILAAPLDVVIDAIDSLTPKIELIAAARQRGLHLVSSMGAALRTDPSKIHCTAAERTKVCPLARQVRKALRGRGVDLDFRCVWSSEPVDTLPETAVGDPEQPSHHPRGRARSVLGSLPTLTGIFGLCCANEALRLLLGDAWPGQT